MSNPKVSLEEIRARRLAAEASQNSNSDSNSESNSGPTADQGYQGSIEGPPVAEATSQTTPAATPSPAAAAPIAILNLDELLANASPDQLAKIRALAAAKGLSAPATGVGTKRADGSMDVLVHLDAAVTEQLELWAEADACTLDEEAQKRIQEALQNYLYGDWSAVVEQPAAAAATTTTTTTTTAAGATK
jgi:hypothetical protein